MPLGIAFIVALIASTVVALTVTPVLCSLLLGNKADNDKLSKEPATARKLRRLYTCALEAVLKRPKPILLATALLFIGACAALPFLGRGFLPKFNEGSFTINIATLPGVSLDESDKIGREAERIILSVPEVRTVARKPAEPNSTSISSG